jgi:septum formation protein
MSHSIVLASASTARTAMLAAAGVSHRVDPATIDEGAVKRRLVAEGADAQRIAGRLADDKALAVGARHRDALVIGADQMLDCAGELFDKPRSPAEARAQLERLSGREHRLSSAVAVVREARVLWRHCAVARMRMRTLSPSFLDSYLAAAGDSVLLSVGAYRLEGLGAQLFERVEGDYFTVLGLPLLPLLGFLREQGVLTT